jgi:hypothetical protein
MNERFNQLLKQVEEETNAEYQDESRRKRRLYNEILLPKFAELIVRECAGRVDWILAEGGGTQGDLIREHFGVEE